MSLVAHPFMETGNVELTIRLQPKQKEAFIASVEVPVLFYGGSKGSGKSYLIRAKEIYNRLKYPNTKGLIVRKTYPELLSNHIRKFFEEYPITREWYNKSEKTIYYPNGSTTEFSYLKNTDDVYTYQGREYENISIDEITQHEEITFKILRSSLRTSNAELSKAGFKPTMLLTGNPGGIGHQWVKRLFVDEEYKPEENPEDFDFIQAFVTDNRALLKADPAYVKRLEDLPDALRRAYLEGDWNIHAGQAFDELSRSKHIIEPYKLPNNTKYFAGYDHGFNHPFAFVLFGVVESGEVVVVAYIKDRKKRPDEIYDMIVDVCRDRGKIEIYAGLDLWTRQRDGSPNLFEQFYNLGLKESNGFSLIRAKTDRVQGVAEIRKWIAWRNTDSEEPKLKFFKNTQEVFNNVSGMQFDPSHPEDVMKVDADEDGNGGDDLYDAFRYGVMSRLSAPKEQHEEYPVDSAMRVLDEHLRLKRAEQSLSVWR